MVQGPWAQEGGGEREREIYFKSHNSLWEHSSHFRLIGRGAPSVSVVSQLVYKFSIWPPPRKIPKETSVLGHIPLEAILGPAYMQHDPVMPDRFFYNKYVSEEFFVSHILSWIILLNCEVLVW